MSYSRSKGRPTTPLVTREKIAKAALTIVRDEGYERLTMARIASFLEVRPSALYHHVSGKEDLLALIEDEVMKQVSCESLNSALSGQLSPGEALYRWAESYRDIFAQHIPLIRLIATTPISGSPLTMRMYDLVAQVFTIAGVRNELVVPRIIMLESFIYGSAYDVHAPSDIFDTPLDGITPVHTIANAKAAFVQSTSTVNSDSGANPYAELPFQLGLKALLADLLED